MTAVRPHLAPTRRPMPPSGRAVRLRRSALPLLLVLGAAGCESGHLGPDVAVGPGGGRSLDLQPTATPTSPTLSVEGAGIPEALVFDAPDLVDGQSYRIVTVPTGPDRTFTGKAFDGAAATHVGERIVDIGPDTASAITLYLLPEITETAIGPSQVVQPTYRTRVDDAATYSGPQPADTLTIGVDSVVSYTVKITEEAVSGELLAVGNQPVTWGTDAPAALTLRETRCLTSSEVLDRGTCTVQVEVLATTPATVRLHATSAGSAYTVVVTIL